MRPFDKSRLSRRFSQLYIHKFKIDQTVYIPLRLGSGNHDYQCWLSNSLDRTTKLRYSAPLVKDIKTPTFRELKNRTIIKKQQDDIIVWNTQLLSTKFVIEKSSTDSSGFLYLI